MSGLAGGAGFVASKGLMVGGRVLVNAERVKNMSVAAKVAVKGGIGISEGYGYQVAGGADPLSKQALGGAAAGGLTGSLGELANPLGKRAGGAVRTRMLAGIEDTPRIVHPLIKGAAYVGNHTTDHVVRGAYKGAVDSSGELIKQVTDNKDGIDYGKVGGKAVGGAVTKPLPTGCRVRPAGRSVRVWTRRRADL